ncbi:MAG: dehydrogenase, partial [Planctomycetes bacterium RBG_16_64_10]
MKLGLGIVGLGPSWDTRHGPALRALSDRFTVRAICAPVAQRAAQVARQFGGRTEDGYQALASREDIDAIVLLSADWYGPLPLLAACQCGKAIYCAVALELDPDQARSIKARVEQAGIAFMAELPCRQAAATLRLKELIATQLGPPRLLFCHQRCVAGDGAGQTRMSRMRHLIEAVDWCRYIVGRDPTSVMGLVHKSQYSNPAEDYQMMSLEFAAPAESSTGVVAQISCGRYVSAQWHEAASFRPPADLQVVCQNGIAFIDLPSTLIWFDPAGRHMESLDSERPLNEQLLAQFHRAVTSLVRDTSNLEDTYRA